MQTIGKHHLHLPNFKYLFCFILLLLSSWTGARPPEYGLRVLGKQNAAVHIVQLFEHGTGRRVWTRPYILVGTCPDNGEFFWARDRRAVAFAIGVDRRNKPASSYEGFHIAVWRAEKRIHVIAHQPMTSSDYVEEMSWSSDARLLLIRTGGSGESLADMGHLYCFDVISQKIYFLGLAVGKPSWAGLRTVKFWRPVFLSDVERGPGMVQAQQASFWHLPKTRKHGKPAT